MLWDFTAADLKTYAKKFIRHHNYAKVGQIDQMIGRNERLNVLLDILADTAPPTLENIDVEEALEDFIMKYVTRRKLKELGGDDDLGPILEI